MSRHDDPAIDSIPRWLILLGVALMVLGGFALAAPWAASTVVDYVFGGSLIAAGLSQLAAAAGTWTWRGFWLTLICGVLSVVAGTAMLAIPVAGIHVLVTFLGLMILFEAVAKLTAAFTVRRDFPWVWLLLNGIVTALLGGVLLLSKADESGVLLGILLGMNLLSSGVAFLASGFALRRVA